MNRRLRVRLVLIGAFGLIVGCGGTGADSAGATVRVYTSVSQDAVDAVVGAFTAANPEVNVEVYRAPTGELTARVAAELRDDDLGADVFWLTDPLSIQQYAADGLLLEWEPEHAADLPDSYRTSSFFGTRVLNMVIVAGADLDAPPSDWDDLADWPTPGEVAIPDPAFAGSAFGALASFALDPAYGLGFYNRLASSGAVQVPSPGDVVTGVADGVYAAGITLDRTANDAITDGSPIQVVWPASGAIAIYSPIAVVAANDNVDAARDFVDFTIAPDGQQAIADSGWQPASPAVTWPEGGQTRSVDWAAAFGRQDELLGGYRSIFDG